MFQTNTEKKKFNNLKQMSLSFCLPKVNLFYLSAPKFKAEKTHVFWK